MTKTHVFTEFTFYLAKQTTSINDIAAGWQVLAERFPGKALFQQSLG
jgi:hypothetical protein